MTTAAVSATLNQSLGDGNYNVASGLGPDVATDAADVSTKFGTAFTALDAFGDALVAITGDTYSDTTHQWTTGGSTGLTHAQVVTLMALFNTASSDFILAKTAAALVVTDLSADATLTINLANVTTMNKLLAVVRGILARIPGLGLVS